MLRVSRSSRSTCRRADGAREICGTGPDRLRQRFECSPCPRRRPGHLVPPGSGIFSDYTGPLVLREFLVAGDVPAMRFKPAYDGSDIETWARVGTRQIGGRLVSVFEPSWPGSAIDRTLTGQRWGWDYLGLYWESCSVKASSLGMVTFPGSAWRQPICHGSPRARRRRAALESRREHRPPGFGEGYVNDEHGFDLASVTSKFYQSFADSYDSIAVVPVDSTCQLHGLPERAERRARNRDESCSTTRCPMAASRIASEVWSCSRRSS